MKKKLLACLISMSMLFGIVPNQPITVSADVVMHESIQMTPYVVQDGTDKDMFQGLMHKYSFSTDGQKIIPLTIPEDGRVLFDMTVVKGGYINIDLFTTSDCSDIPVHINCHCPYDRYCQGHMELYMKKGTYYLRFPNNTYNLDVFMFSNETKNITGSGFSTGYCDHRNALVYNYTPQEDGYLVLSESELSFNTSSVMLQLCDAKGNPLTEANSFSKFLENDQIYAVAGKKTYQIKMTSIDTNGTSFFQLYYKFTARKENSGDKKKKAVAVTLGKTVEGTVLAAESEKKTDWYKIKIKKNSKLQFQYSGSVSSGAIVFDVYDSKGNALMTSGSINCIDGSGNATLHKKTGGSTLGKGTYYVKVTKNIKATSGIYSWIMIKK